MKYKQSHQGFELVSPCPFPTTITITPRATPKLARNDVMMIIKIIIRRFQVTILGNLAREDLYMFKKGKLYIIQMHAATKSTIMTNEHASLEKYTSHTLFEMVAKGLRKGYVWEVSWRLNRDCNILTPSSSVFSSTSFSFCRTAQPGALRAQPSSDSWFSLPRTATTDSKLTEPPVAPGYIIFWHPPASCERRICTQFNPSTVKAISWCLRTDAFVFRLTAGPKVNMLQIFKREI